METNKGFATVAIVVLVIGILAVGVGAYYIKNKSTSYLTYTECVEKTKLPCIHLFVGDFGQKWVPSPFASKEKCDTENGGYSCIIPPGIFLEDRWISARDLQRAKQTEEKTEIQSTEESTSEVFKNQPGEIKSIESKGSNEWLLAVDLLSHNPKWIPGVDSTGGFFINQNPKIRNLNVSNTTNIYVCGPGPDENDTSADILVSTSDFIKEIQSSDYKTRYFDINGSNITAVYQQCLP